MPRRAPARGRRRSPGRPRRARRVSGLIMATLGGLCLVGATAEIIPPGIIAVILFGR